MKSEDDFERLYLLLKQEVEELRDDFQRLKFQVGGDESIGYKGFQARLERAEELLDEVRNIKITLNNLRWFAGGLALFAAAIVGIVTQVFGG